jgi:hypothetical protein
VHYLYIRHFHVQLFHVNFVLRYSTFYSTLICEVSKTRPQFYLSLFGVEWEKALSKTASRFVNNRYPKVTLRMYVTSARFIAQSAGVEWSQLRLFKAKEGRSYLQGSVYT